jgi:hypothetical protein
VSVANLISLLNEVEGWGDQHIYLFQSTPRQAEDYNSPVHLRSIFEEHGILHLYNRRNPLVLPAQPELTASSRVASGISVVASAIAAKP